MGVVYEAWDSLIDRRVALKMLRIDRFEPSDLPEMLARFKREAQSVGRLAHPHIVTIYDYGDWQGSPYLVMEFMEGRELAQELKTSARFPLEVVVRIMTQMLGALAHAHERGVVHRDLKPANMFLLGDGALKVVDFGLARIEDSDLTALTNAGTVLGTPAYMSPEQVDALPMDHRTDLFSAGIILYELLTGEKPFKGGSVHTIQQAIRKLDPLVPSDANPTLSPVWDRVIARALAKKPVARYENARQFSEAIQDAFQAERGHAEEARLKATEAAEHVLRAAEDRSRAEAQRRAEDERREVERIAKAEAAARAEAEKLAKLEADAREKAEALLIQERREREEEKTQEALEAQRNILMDAKARTQQAVVTPKKAAAEERELTEMSGREKTTSTATEDRVKVGNTRHNVAQMWRPSRKQLFAAAISLVLATFGVVFYKDQDVRDKISEATTARIAADTRSLSEARKREKAEAIAREEAEKRIKLEIEVARKEAEAKVHAEVTAKTHAEETEKRAKLEAEVARRESEAKRQTENAAKVRATEEAKRLVEEKAQMAALKKAEAERANAEVRAKQEIEARIRSDAEYRRKEDSKAEIKASNLSARQKKYDPGATDREIRIGNINPYTGPASAYSTMAKVQAAYFNKVNAEGGINGRQIAFISFDDGYSPPKTVEMARKLVEQEEVLFLVSPLGTPTNSAIHRYLNTKKVPQLFVSSGATKWNDPTSFPWTMGWQPNYQTEGSIYAKHILRVKPAAKIAVLYQNDLYGRDYLKGFKEGLGDKVGLIIQELSYEVTEPTLDSQLVRLQASGADVFFSITTPKFAAQAIRKAYEIGWKPMHYLNSVSASIGSVLTPAGLDKSIGIISAQYLKDPLDSSWANDKGMNDWKNFMSTYYPQGNVRDGNNVYGYSVAQTIARVILQCGNDLTRENVMRQAARLKNFEPSLILPGIEVNTSASDFAPIEQMQLVRFDGRQWIRFGEIASK